LFVKSLEKDYMLVCNGTAIEYGAQYQSWEEVVELIGFPKATKHHPEPTDGQPPDTMDAVVGMEKTISKGKTSSVLSTCELGWPLGSGNVDCYLLTTDQSYKKGTVIGKLNCCWESSSLETLNALWSPLW
ncbi:hypothetical protein CROQUDRAFT_33141, partial [Cronartium quercuum f. sp. fusiforme G11]